MSFIKYMCVTGLTCCALTVAHGEQVYRWVDDQSNIHYSDSLPPEQSQRDQELINEKGRIVKTIEGPKTPEELEHEKIATEAAKQQQQQKEQEAQRDRVLLATFMSVDDLRMVRDERVTTIESAIQIAEKKLQKYLDKLKELNATEERFHAQKLPTPGWVTKEKENANLQIENINALLEIKVEEKSNIERKFADDITRYMELTQTN